MINGDNCVDDSDYDDDDDDDYHNDYQSLEEQVMLVDNDDNVW